MICRWVAWLGGRPGGGGGSGGYCVVTLGPSCGVGGWGSGSVLTKACPSALLSFPVKQIPE